jgi:alkyl sulfatase BDS1-like metallo-beta-lactamase superfamily hydrolase
MYKYLHDETLRLANQGYTILEIPEIIRFPSALFRAWYNRSYYGSVNHNVKAIYQRYLGFFDGNPANLHPLPPQEAGKNYVDFMGGTEAVLAKARQSFAAGDYRWVAQVVNHLVFADPDNQDARALQADALEQLGYQSESGPWRNCYLSGAKELRDGVVKHPMPVQDIIRSVPSDLLFDLLAVQLNGSKADGKTITLNATFTDVNEQFTLSIKNGVLNYRKGKRADAADASLTTTRAVLNQLILGETTWQNKLAANEAIVEGSPEKLIEFLSLMDTFEQWFNIVTP